MLILKQGTGSTRMMSRERDTGIALLTGWHLSSRGPPARRRSLWMPREFVVAVVLMVLRVLVTGSLFSGLAML